MTNTAQDGDVAFFNLMHHFLAASHKGDDATDRDDPEVERRDVSRRAYHLTQRIAPNCSWEVPPESAWIDVLCYDLAQCGFSFFLDEKPNFDRLLVKFRSAEPIHVAARVTYWRPVVVDIRGNIVEPGSAVADSAQPLRRTESKFLVGCQFLRRFAP